MAEKMTLEEVSAWHRSREVTFRRTGSSGLSSEHKSMADAIDAHLAQPAQAVDVGAIREVIDDLREWGETDAQLAARAVTLTRAIGDAREDGE